MNHGIGDDHHVNRGNGLLLETTHYGHRQRSLALHLALPDTAGSRRANDQRFPADYQGPGERLDGFPKARLVAEDTPAGTLEEAHSPCLEWVEWNAQAGHRKVGRLLIQKR